MSITDSFTSIFTFFTDKAKEQPLIFLCLGFVILFLIYMSMSPAPSLNGTLHPLNETTQEQKSITIKETGCFWQISYTVSFLLVILAICILIGYLVPSENLQQIFGKAKTSLASITPPTLPTFQIPYNSPIKSAMI